MPFAGTQNLILRTREQNCSTTDARDTFQNPETSPGFYEDSSCATACILLGTGIHEASVLGDTRLVTVHLGPGHCLLCVQQNFALVKQQQKA